MSVRRQTTGAVLLALALLVALSGVVRYIPNDRVGVVEKLWSLSGSVRSSLLALRRLLIEGTYYLNRLFATVEIIAKTVIPVGSGGEAADKQLMQTVMLRLAEAFETARVPLVSQIRLGSSSANGGGDAFFTLQADVGVEGAGAGAQKDLSDVGC